MAKMDDIYKASPVDRVAARVSGPGFPYEPNKRLNQDLWVGPPPMIEIPSWDMIVGTTRGRATVIGYLNPKKVVIRCVCGNYEMRDAKVWRRGVKLAIPDTGCQICRQDHEYLPQKDRWRRFLRENPGYDVSYAEFMRLYYKAD